MPQKRPSTTFLSENETICGAMTDSHNVQHTDPACNRDIVGYFRLCVRMRGRRKDGILREVGVGGSISKFRNFDS